MKIITFLCTVLVLVGATQGVSAHDIGIGKSYSACMDHNEDTMIGCITVEFKRQDVRLNKAYKALMAELPPPRKTALQEAQRAWLKFRDANCGFYNDPDGGSLALVNANDCMMTATAARARELEGFRQND